MHHYDYQKELQNVWEHAVRVYQSGVGEPGQMFPKEQIDFLSSIGQNEQQMFDYAEDYANGAEPCFGDVASVADIRRAYFLDVQNGVPSRLVGNPDDLPSRNAEAGGLAWLPRVVTKAKQKLRGELHPSVMYGCAADRAFLKLCDIHPAELLRKVWQFENNDPAVYDWVCERFAKRDKVPGAL